MNSMPAITVRANGLPHTARPGIPLPEFIQSLDLDLERVIVERNGTPLTRKEAAVVTLENGDCLEIVRIVAGG